MGAHAPPDEAAAAPIDVSAAVGAKMDAVASKAFGLADTIDMVALVPGTVLTTHTAVPRVKVVPASKSKEHLVPTQPLDVRGGRTVSEIAIPAFAHAPKSTTVPSSLPQGVRDADAGAKNELAMTSSGAAVVESPVPDTVNPIPNVQLSITASVVPTMEVEAPIDTFRKVSRSIAMNESDPSIAVTEVAPPIDKLEYRANVHDPNPRSFGRSNVHVLATPPTQDTFVSETSRNGLASRMLANSSQ